MLSAMSKRTSEAASAERIASLVVITLLTTVRLMRSVWVSSARRCLTALGTSRPVRGSSSTMNPRSACTKIVNRLSSSFGKTSASPRAFPKFWLISSRAFSLASVFTSSRRPVGPVLTANFDMIVELPVGRSSSTIVTAGAGSRRWPAGGVTARSSGPRWKTNERSQMPTWSFSQSNCRPATSRPFNSVPLRLWRSSM